MRVNQIPRGWKLKKLGEALEIQNGYAFDSRNFDDKKGFPIIRIRDLKTNKPSKNYVGRYDKKLIVKNGDLLIGMDGEFRCYKWLGPEALLNQRVCRLQHFREVVPEFIMYGINKFLKKIEDETSFVTVKHISSGQIAEIEFPFPPMDLQGKIVSRIKELTQRIEEAKRLRDTAWKEAEAIMPSSLHTVFSRLVEKVCKMEKILTVAEIKGGGTPSKNNPNFWNGTIPWVSPKDMKNHEILDTQDHITKEAVKHSTTNLIPSGNVLVVFRSGILAHSFPVAINKVPVTINQDMKAIIPHQELHSEFLAFYLRSIERQILKEYVKFGPTVHSIKSDHFYELKVPVVSKEEQGIVVDYCQRLENLVEELNKLQEQTRKEIDATSASILDKAFRGELVN